MYLSLILMCSVTLCQQQKKLAQIFYKNLFRVGDIFGRETWLLELGRKGEQNDKDQ